MTIAAVVVRWKGGDEVERCLRSLSTNTGKILGEIVLVDADSGDGGAQRLAKIFPEIRVELLPTNPGFAGAANHGVNVSNADSIFLLNPDAEVRCGALEVLANHLEEHADLAGVVPLLENSDGSSQHRWQLKNLPSKRDLCFGRSGRPAFVHAPQRPAAVTQPAAAAWFVRRAVWDTLGGLDQAFYPAWWEDVDFCARLHRRIEDPAVPWNQAFQVVPEARVRHLGGSSVSSLGDAAFLDAFYGNLLRYAERHHTDDLSLIQNRLRIALAARALINPTRLSAYMDVINMVGRGIRKQPDPT